VPESAADRLAKLVAKKGVTKRPQRAAPADTSVGPRPSSQLIVGECREIMASMPANSFDAIITDPGVSTSEDLDGWVKQVPGPSFWDAMLRVAKPGAWMAIYSGRRCDHRVKTMAEDAGWEIKDTIMWVFPKGAPMSLDVGQLVDKKIGGPGIPYFRTIGSMTDGQREAFMGDTDNPWYGYGTELRPTWEPIALFRKPTHLTYADNAIRYGTGVVNIDATRIPSGERDAIATHIPEGQGDAHGLGLQKLQRVVGTTSLGRWPADALLSHAPECSGGGDSTGEGCSPRCPVGLMGSAAKFFYCAKTSRTEKDIGLAVKGNPAKSVKPAAVNEWISNLVLPRGGALLDPFMGTGSTGMGAMAVPGSTFVGIDQKQSMVDIAAKRLAAWGAERHT
jgi:hypothetical protein